MTYPAIPPFNEIEPFLKKVILLAGKIADSCGEEVFLVGGVVRDLLMKRAITDVDIMVVGDGIDFARKLADALRVKNIVPYARFGTALIPYKNYSVEVASARAEYYEPHSRKPEVEFCDYRTDLSRRDFTINAMALRLNGANFWQLIDLFGGEKDIQNRALRTPLEPDQTFSDDPLRMMRAVRFATQLRFFIEPEIHFSIKRMAERIEIISMERVRDELNKILASPKPSIGLSILEEVGLMKLVIPEISRLKGVEQIGKHHHKDVFHHTLKVVDNSAKSSEPDQNGMILRWAALFHDVAKPRTKKFQPKTGWTFHFHEELGARMVPKIFRKLRLPNDFTKDVTTLVRLHLRPIQIAIEGVTDSAVRRMMLEAGDLIDLLIDLCRADITSKNPQKVARYKSNFDRVAKMIQDVHWKDELRAFQSPITGEEIMQECDVKPSPIVGKIKFAIEEAILDGIIPNDRNSAWKYFLQNKIDWLAGKNLPEKQDRMIRFKKIKEEI